MLAGGGDGTLGHLVTALAEKTMKMAGKEEEINRENPTFVKPKITVGTLPVIGSYSGDGGVGVMGGMDVVVSNGIDIYWSRVRIRGK